MRLLPIGVGVVTGAVDGAIALADAKAGRNTNLKQWSTYAEAGGLVVSALAGMNRVHSDLWEPVFYGTLTLLSRRAGAWAGHQAGIGGPGYGDGYGGARQPRAQRPGVGAPYLPAAVPPVTTMGFERMQPAGMFG